MFLTYADAIDHGLDYLGSGIQTAAGKDVRRAIHEAYRDLTNSHNWTYLYRHGRLITKSQYGTSLSAGSGSSVSYLHSSGTVPREVTLYSGTWPSYAAGCYLRVGEANYRVATRVSDTVLTLDDQVNPGADLAGGTTYTLFQDTYVLPADFLAQDQALYESSFGGMSFTHPRDWMYENRYSFSTGTPGFYCITGDPQYPGRLVTRIHPIPLDAMSVDFSYKRRPRPLVYEAVEAGTASVTASGITVLGIGTPFTPEMVGSVIRMGGMNSNTLRPTDHTGTNPALFESVIMNWISATQVLVADMAPAAISGASYVISDPVDIEPGAMLNAYLRCVEHHLSMARVMKDRPSARLQYREALGHARAADSRSFAGRAVGDQVVYSQRLADMPVGPDVL